MNRKIVLASASPRRQELIRILCLEAESIASSVDETVDSSWSPQQIVEQLAIRKASSVATQIYEQESGAIVIGSDTIVTLDGEVYGKPANKDEASHMLSQLQGRTHVVYTGVACVTDITDDHYDLSHTRERDHAQQSTLAAQQSGEPSSFRRERKYGQQFLVGHTENKVTIRAMSEEEIAAYIATDEPMDKAGAYGIQGIGAVFVEKIEGDFYSVMGLPVHLLYRMLVSLGVNPLQPYK